MTYARMAEIYDRIYGFKDYATDVAYVVDKARELHPGARALLETACGTGNHTALLKRHFEVEGLDLSPQMLELARKKLPGITFHEASMVDFSLPRRFDVVTCLFRSIAYVRTVANLHAAIAAMARHVAPGGLLLIEPYFTPETYWVDRVTMHESGDDSMKIAWSYVSARRDMLSILDMHYLVATPRGVEHFTETHELGLFTVADFQRGFKAAGLQWTYDPIGPTKVGCHIGRMPS
jgi:ubiquinone/menaquinone biosynthesis C-methylase UbiE